MERFLQDGDNFGITITGALSEPICTLVSTNAGRIAQDSSWPNIEGRTELGFGALQQIHGGKCRPPEIGVSGVVGQT